MFNEALLLCPDSEGMAGQHSGHFASKVDIIPFQIPYNSKQKTQTKSIVTLQRQNKPGSFCNMKTDLTCILLVEAGLRTMHCDCQWKWSSPPVTYSQKKTHCSKARCFPVFCLKLCSRFVPREGVFDVAVWQSLSTLFAGKQPKFQSLFLREIFGCLPKGSGRQRCCEGGLTLICMKRHETRKHNQGETVWIFFFYKYSNT